MFYLSIYSEGARLVRAARLAAPWEEDRALAS